MIIRNLGNELINTMTLVYARNIFVIFVLLFNNCLT